MIFLEILLNPNNQRLNNLNKSHLLLKQITILNSILDLVHLRQINRPLNLNLSHQLIKETIKTSKILMETWLETIYMP